MKNKTMRTFVIDGKEMQFNLTFFNSIFKTKAKQEKKGIGEYEEALAEAIFVEKSTVHAWRNRVNGPSDIDKVQQIADFFGLNVADFLVEVEDMLTYENRKSEMENYLRNIEFGSREKDAFKRVYKEMLSFMNLRITYDKEMSDAIEEKFWDEIAYENLPEEELEKEGYYDLPLSLDAYTEGVKDMWSKIDFDQELEKVSRTLEEELVDMPNVLYIMFETFISLLEMTNSKNVEVDGDYDFENELAVAAYEEERIRNLYIRNERIISVIKEKIRELLFEIKN